MITTHLSDGENRDSWAIQNLRPTFRLSFAGNSRTVSPVSYVDSSAERTTTAPKLLGSDLKLYLRNKAAMSTHASTSR